MLAGDRVLLENWFDSEIFDTFRGLKLNFRLSDSLIIFGDDRASPYDS